MGFDAQAFATAFLEGQAVDIKARVKEAKDEIKRKKELARTVGVSQFKKRTQLYETMKNQILNLKNYHGTDKGMTQRNLNALMDNPAALVEVNNILKDYETNFQEKMDVKTMNDLISFTGEYSSPTDQNGNPVSLDQRLRKVAGLYMGNHQPTSSDPSAKETNMLLSIFGIGAEERMLANLSQQDRTLIEMAEQGEYVPENLSPISVDRTKIDTVVSYPQQQNQFDSYKLEVLKYARDVYDKEKLALEKIASKEGKKSEEYVKRHKRNEELWSAYDRANKSDAYEGGALAELEQMNNIGVTVFNRLYSMKGQKSYRNNTIISPSVIATALNLETENNEITETEEEKKARLEAEEKARLEAEAEKARLAELELKEQQNEKQKQMEKEFIAQFRGASPNAANMFKMTYAEYLEKETKGEITMGAIYYITDSDMYVIAEPPEDK